MDRATLPHAQSTIALYTELDAKVTVTPFEFRPDIWPQVSRVTALSCGVVSGKMQKIATD